MKTCNKCAKTLPIKEYYHNKGMKDGHLNICKECVDTQVKEYVNNNRPEVYARQRIWRQANIEHVRDLGLKQYYKHKDEPKYKINGAKRAKIYLAEIRLEMLEHYGYSCACCGESNPKFLTIDHLNEGGNKHRKELGGTIPFYCFLKRNNYPSGYQTLCFNCNIAKARNLSTNRNNVCPHISPTPDTINPIEQHAWVKSLARLRNQIYGHYGRRCSCCGLGDELFLSIDHVNGNGNKQRTSLGGTRGFYKWLIENEFPNDVQIMCFNCNMGRYRNKGGCPHNDLPSLNLAVESK
jgi:hypothetical protein